MISGPFNGVNGPERRINQSQSPEKRGVIGVEGQNGASGADKRL